MYGQQMYYGNPGMVMMPNMMYSAPTVKPNFQKNPIGDEGIKLLKSKGGGKLNFHATKEEMLKMLCTHNTDQGPDLFTDDMNEGRYHCNICGEELNLKAVYNPAVVSQIVDYLVAAFNNIKLKNNGVISNDILTDLAKSMVLLKRFPSCLEVVNKNYERIDNMGQGVFQSYGSSVANTVNMITGGGGMSYVPMYSTGGVYQQSMLPGNPFMGTVMPQGQAQPVMAQPVMPQQPVMSQPVIVNVQTPQGIVPHIQTPQGLVPYNPNQGMVMAQPQPQTVMPGVGVAPAAAAGTVVPEVTPPVGGTKTEVSKVFNG